MVRILPTGLIPKTTQNYKPLWVPNPKILMEFRHKPNPTHTQILVRVSVLPWYPKFGYPILAIRPTNCILGGRILGIFA